MPNTLYDKARESFLKGEINWLSDTIKVALVNNDYIPNIETHQYLTDITTGIIQKSVALNEKSTTKGVAGAANVTFSTANEDTAVPAGNVAAIIIYQQANTDANSRLIAYINQINGLPFATTATSTDLTIHWDQGPNKIFKL